jgi:hypothetical protein
VQSQADHPVVEDQGTLYAGIEFGVLSKLVATFREL